jgi:hypothetical protein
LFEIYPAPDGTTQPKQQLRSLGMETVVIPPITTKILIQVSSTFIKHPMKPARSPA